MEGKLTRKGMNHVDKKLMHDIIWHSPKVHKFTEQQGFVLMNHTPLGIVFALAHTISRHE